MAPELFFVYGPADDQERNLERMKKEHPFTSKSDAFSVGFLAKMIWKDEDNAELFRGDSIYKMSFRVKIDNLLHEDPNQRSSLGKVVETLMGPPYNFPHPESCYRYNI